jgi:cytochrome c553
MKIKILATGLLGFLVLGCNVSQQTPTLDLKVNTTSAAAFGTCATEPCPTPVTPAVPQDPSPALIASCSKCHGADGNGANPLFARLGAQTEDYIAAQLLAYKDGTRGGKDAKLYMYPAVSKLTAQEIADLAHYFATRTAPKPLVEDAALIAQGADIYNNGSGDSIMACMACHGEKGEGMSLNPRLAGQFPREMIKQMANYKNSDRKDDMMISIAQALTDDQNKALAAFLASIDNVAPPALVPQEPSASLVTSCNKCHGADGSGTNILFARLGAQSEEYLAAQLNDYKTGARGGKDAKVFMYSVAKKLTDQDIVNLSHFYATRPGPAPIAGGADLIAMGEDIYKNGVGDTVMACILCHGEKAEGFSVNPRLAGQFPRETIKQMGYYKTTDRKDDMMGPVAAGMSDEQNKAVAAYLGSLSGCN